MFHYNRETGEVGNCEATVGRCPYGTPNEHYTTREAAGEAYGRYFEALPKYTAVSTENHAVIYEISSTNLPAAIKHLERANRKLEKAGVDNRFTYTVEEYALEDPARPGFAENRARITLNTPAVSFEGYTFLAVVESASSGNIVKQATGIELRDYAPDTMLCQACGRNIKRQKTYLIEDSEGNMIQVGSGCIKNYFGVQPEGLWALTFDPIERASRTSEWGHAKEVLVDTELILAHALAVSKGGENFVSRRMAEDYGQNSTAGMVRDFLNRGPSRYAPEQEKTAKDYIDSGEAKALLESIRSSSANTNYGRNLSVIASGERTKWSHINILVSGLSVLAREKREAAKAAEEAIWGAPTVGFAGDPGDKIADKKLKVKKVRHNEIEDPYSYRGHTKTTTQITFRDEDNHEIIWWSSNFIDVEEGSEVVAKSGTVKKHDNYNGVDQTVLTRVRLDL